MQKYLEKMLREKEDVSGKIQNAKKALQNTGLYKLDDTQRKLLRDQVGFMEKYLSVLENRIRYETRLKNN